MQKPVDISAAILTAKAAKIKQYPRRSNRASEVGHDCERYLVLARSRWQERKPHDVTLQCIFDFGNWIEKMVVADLADSGITFMAQQQSFEDRTLELTGHIDGMVEVNNRTYPAEIKGLAHHTWESLNTFEDFFTSRAPWVRKYPAQLTLYLFMAERELGVFVIYSKTTAEPKDIWIPLDWDYADSLVKKLERVNAHLAAGTLPPQIDDAEQCVKCDFFDVCLPEIRRNSVIIADDPEVITKLDRWNELKPAYLEYNRLNKELRFEGVENAIIGDYLVTGKWNHKEGYHVEARDEWRKKITKLVPAPEHE